MNYQKILTIRLQKSYDVIKNQNQQEKNKIKQSKKNPPWPIQTTFHFSMMQVKHTEKNDERSNKEFRSAINSLWPIILVAGSKPEK